MPATVAALVVVAAGALDHGFMTLKPMPLPISSRTGDRRADTRTPARMAHQDTAELGAGSFSTMTVSTIGAFLLFHRNNGKKRAALHEVARFRPPLRRLCPASIGP